jgi:hypothetical protein
VYVCGGSVHSVVVAPLELEAGPCVALCRPVAMALELRNSGPVEALWHFVPPGAELDTNVTVLLFLQHIADVLLR